MKSPVKSTFYLKYQAYFDKNLQYTSIKKKVIIVFKSNVFHCFSILATASKTVFFFLYLQVLTLFDPEKAASTKQKIMFQGSNIPLSEGRCFGKNLPLKIDFEIVSNPTFDFKQVIKSLSTLLSS